MAITPHSERWLIVIPIVLGICSFFLVLSPHVLDPRNIAWLAGGGDTTQHYLGWAFYRYGPWTMPLGLNPLYGLEVSSSIVYSDSIPLMAFICKPFSAWLSEPFQYLGIWMLICFVLQACFAWLLIGLFSSDVAIRFLGSALLVFAPPMLFRLVVHIPLASHFVILAALYLVLRSSLKYRTQYWTLLLCSSVLINFYLLVMALLLWVSDLVDRALARKAIAWKSIITEVLTIGIALGFSFWQAGYLALESASSSWGLGFYRMNLLSIFNPMGWSYLLDGLYINSVAGEYEGFNYLGLGLLFLLAIAIWKIRFQRKWLIARGRSRPALCLALISFTFFSLSHQIGVATLNFNIPISESLLSFAGTLRSSGRLFWPVWYCLVLVSIYVISRTFSRSTVLVILILLGCIQIVDTSAKWWPRHQDLASLNGSQFPNHLQNPFWSNAPKLYSQVLRRILPENPPDWEILSAYAQSKKMGTDSVYLARVDRHKIKMVNQQFKDTLISGNWDKHSLYVIDNASVLPMLAQLNSKEDLFARIDDQNIFAPGWLVCSVCDAVDAALWVKNQVPQLGLRQILLFSNAFPKNEFILTKGWWTWPDSWGTWSSEKDAQINLLIPKGNVQKLTLLVRALISPMHPVQRVEVLVNGRPLKIFNLEKPEHNEIVLPLDAQMRKEGFLVIQFIFLDATQPKEIGLGKDDRYLAIGMESAQFE